MNNEIASLKKNHVTPSKHDATTKDNPGQYQKPNGIKKLVNNPDSKWKPANKSNKKRFLIYSKNYGTIVGLRKTISRAARYKDYPDYIFLQSLTPVIYVL